MGREFLLLLGLVALCLGACHHNCNHHGQCVEGSCECDENWVGSDCSVPFLPLESGQSVRATVSGDWVFYFTDVKESPASMTYHIVDSLLGDCDLYIRYEEFPSKNHFNYSSNGWGSESSIIIEHPATGVWVAGVYNFFACSFTMSLTIDEIGNCPNDCSDHGICNVDNECLCDSLWSGMDCSQEVIQLIEGVKRTDAVTEWKWAWYYYDAQAVNGVVPDFALSVKQLGEGDTDLYIKYGELPLLWDYDYRNALVNDSYALTVGSPVEGRYFIGVYGYDVQGEVPLSFTIELSASSGSGSECESHCSSHGFCSNGACRCDGPFDGDNCERMTRDLTEGQSVAGFANNNQWNFFTATANSATNMIITVDQDWNQGGDCDLYIRADEDPTRFDFDFRNIGFDSSFSIVVQNPLATTWHIGVYGYRQCQYYITETLDSGACPDNCSGHGTCVSGRCSCANGFAGQNCASPLLRIHSKDLMEGTIGQNKWSYFKFSAPDSHTSITIELIEVETEGYMGLYVLQGAPPELTGSQYSDTQINRLHNVYFRYDGSGDSDHDFYIGVYGNSLVPLGSPVPFKVFVYCPPI